jgi:DNA-binding Lrp family transcriptional regulator
MKNACEYVSRALNNYQRNFPLVTRPFAMVGTELGLNEQDTIALFCKLKDENKITRIGPVFKPNTIGASTLAAMQVPPERLDEVASFVSSLPEVNHNYERENILNLWFVITANDPKKLTEVLDRIEQHTQIKVHDLRLEEEFRIDLGFNLNTNPSSSLHLDFSQDRAPKEELIKTNTFEMNSDFSIKSEIHQQLDFSEKTDLIAGLIAEIEKGIPLTEEPFKDIAIKLNTNESTILAAIKYLQKTKSIRRFGVVVRHRELGYSSNAMVVWNIPEDIVSELGHKIVSDPSLQFVSLCYKRRKSLPSWNYNFYCMIHGKNREEVMANIETLNHTINLHYLNLQNLNQQNVCQQILFSKTCFKQKGARYSKFEKQTSEKLLLNLLQEGIPVDDEPYKAIAHQTGFTEEEVLNYIKIWLNDGTLSRFGPMFNVEKFGGEFTLVAMQVPSERFAEVNDCVNSFTEVAHNYEREHELNMWFVLATSAAEQTEHILKKIEHQTQLKTFSLPKLEEYYLNLRFQA